MFDYDAERLRRVILELTRSTISSDAWDWFQGKLGVNESSVIYGAFSLIPRMTGKNYISVDQGQQEELRALKPGFELTGWTADRLTRVCLLLHLDPVDQEIYVKRIESLFNAAEMSELAALYSALPLLAFPERWQLRCAEGIRSNIGTVLEAIMYHNPYAASYLDEKAWNQLVMKAFFTDKDITRITGIEERANPELSLILSDWAHERWAAGRSINPLVWRIAGKCADERIKNDLKRAISEGSEEEKREAEKALHS